jgi:electron transfer flavoprotein alpha subunit
MINVLILGELTDSKTLDPVTGELIAAAEQLGDGICVLLMGTGLDGAAGEAIALGAGTIYTVEDEALDGQAVDLQVLAMTQVCQQVNPKVVLVGKTQNGRDIGPRVAFRLGAGLAQDCIRIGIAAETGRVVATRPVYGGNAVATVTFSGNGTQVVLMRGKVYEAPVPDSSKTGEVVAISVDLGGSVNRVRSLRTVAQASEGVRLEDANIVVSGGRGLGGAEPFEMVQELAHILGGAMGASRAACDAGWLDHSYQVGLTGRTIAPNVYITVGISGASQHMAGCSGAKNVVAINKDREANIFKEATYGVVGDWQGVLPSFMETIRELVKS